MAATKSRKVDLARKDSLMAEDRSEMHRSFEPQIRLSMTADSTWSIFLKGQKTVML